jgi:hypothetical protein
VPVTNRSLASQEVDKIQASLDFKIVDDLSSDGEAIYFEKVPGRTEKVEALLEGIGGSRTTL